MGGLNCEAPQYSTGYVWQEHGSIDTQQKVQVVCLSNPEPLTSLDDVSLGSSIHSSPTGSQGGGGGSGTSDGGKSSSGDSAGMVDYLTIEGGWCSETVLQISLHIFDMSAIAAVWKLFNLIPLPAKNNFEKYYHIVVAMVIALLHIWII